MKISIDYLHFMMNVVYYEGEIFPTGLFVGKSKEAGHCTVNRAFMRIEKRTEKKRRLPF